MGWSASDATMNDRHLEKPLSSDLIYGSGLDGANHHINQPESLQSNSRYVDRKLMTKIDLRVIPVLSVMYLLAFLDRYGNWVDCYLSVE